MRRIRPSIPVTLFTTGAVLIVGVLVTNVIQRRRHTVEETEERRE